MGADVIQANYDELEIIATRFGQCAESNAQMISRVRQGMERLKQGDWIGKGSEAFFKEMDGEVLPAIDRLTQALQQSQSVINQIIFIVQQAEEEAAEPFRNGDSDSFGSQSTSSFPSGSFPKGDVSSSPTIHPMPAPPASDGSIWDHLRPKGKFFEYDGRQKGGKFDPELKLTVGIEESSVWGSAKSDSIAGVGGYVEAGAKISKEGVLIGAGGEFYAVKGEWDTAFVGDKEYGVTGGIGFKGLSAEAFGGIQFDDKGKGFGASIGGNLVSVEGSVGANVAGVNVSVTGEVGLKAELGFRIGRETEIKLPFFSVGFKFGGGVD
jgi:WXG100 family type VII secretion target